MYSVCYKNNNHWRSKRINRICRHCHHLYGWCRFKYTSSFQMDEPRWWHAVNRWRVCTATGQTVQVDMQCI